MDWNWHQADWPKLRWEAAPLQRVEERFLLQDGEFAGVVQHLGATDREQLTVEAISTESVTTSTIEGEVLDRTSVQSSIRRELGLATDRRRVKPAEQGVAEMMVDLYRTFAEPLSNETLFRRHRMLLSVRHGLGNVGGYRTDPEPMQVVSGPLSAPRVHFEALPSSTVPEEMPGS
jgi:Fic family protein